MENTKQELLYGAELAALLGLAVVQPVLDVMGRAPDYFLFRGAGQRELLLLAGATVFAPMVVVWGTGLVANLGGRRARLWVHRASVLVLVLIAVVHLLKVVSPLRGVLLAAVGLAIAAAALVAYARVGGVATWLRFMSPGPFVFALVFLLMSPASVLLTGDGTAKALAGTEARAPVVLIVFDELPLVTLLNSRGQIDERLYTNFAQLARQSHWFRNATAVSGHTTAAVPALLTGRFPERDDPPHLSSYPDNLFTLLGGSYRIDAVENVTQLCPTDLCNRVVHVEGGMSVLLPEAARTWARTVSPRDATADPASSVGVELSEVDDAPAEEGEPQGRVSIDLSEARADLPLPRSVRGFLGSVDGRARSFSFLHVLLPHVPWRHLPDGTPFGDVAISRYAGPNVHDEVWPYVVDQHRHLLQTIYTDAVLGAIIEHLRDVGIYDRALLVVTADHGLSFVPGRDQLRKALTAENPAQLMWVPLLVKLPGQRDGSIVDDNAMLVDVTPTIADVVGVSVPWSVDGISLLGDPRRTGLKYFRSRGGVPRHVDGEQWYPTVTEGVVDQLVRPDDGEVGLYRVGRWGHLVGTRLAEHRSETDTNFSPEMGRIHEFDDVDVGAYLPALVTGQLRAVPRRLDGVAVVVNGVIAGTSEVFPLAGHESAFATMLWPGVFRDGKNSVDVVGLREEEGQVTAVLATNR